LAWRPTAVLFVALGILFWSIPVSREVTAPAVLHAQTEQAIYAPMEARLRSLRVKPGQEVAAGVVLAVLDAPELAVRGRQADLSIASFTAELQRAAASSMRQEQLGVLQEGLAEAYAKRQSVLEETARLELRAPFSGRVRDLPPDIVEGRWVNPRQLLMRIVTDYTDIVEVYVSESQVGGVQSGQSVRFYPSVSTMPVMHGVVTSVDKTPSRGISRPLLASVHGGGLAAVKDRKEGLIAYDPVFRVLVRPSDNYPSPGYVLRGTARIETDLRLVAQNFYTRIISILIREKRLLAQTGKRSMLASQERSPLGSAGFLPQRRRIASAQSGNRKTSSYINNIVRFAAANMKFGAILAVMQLDDPSSL